MSSRITRSKSQIQTYANQYQSQLSESPLLIAIIEELRQIRGGDSASLERDARRLLQDVFASKASELAAA